MTKEEQLYYTTIGHIEDAKCFGMLEIRALSSLGIPAWKYMTNSNSIDEFLEKVDRDWNILKHSYEERYTT